MLFRSNRTAADVRLAFSKNGGNLGESGCVAYLFDQLGVVWLEGLEPLAEDPLLELLLELDVHSYRLDDRQGEIWCPIPSLEGLHRQLLAAGWPVQEAELRWRPQTLVDLGDPDSLQQLERLLDSLDGLDDVRSVNCNLAG